MASVWRPNNPTNVGKYSFIFLYDGSSQYYQDFVLYNKIKRCQFYFIFFYDLTIIELLSIIIVCSMITILMYNEVSI